jgi:hypothetical protein
MAKLRRLPVRRVDVCRGERHAQCQQLQGIGHRLLLLAPQPLTGRGVGVRPCCDLTHLATFERAREQLGDLAPVADRRTPGNLS